MNENNIFLREERVNNVPQSNQNNCYGHQRSIDAGGQGHWYGDGCGCDLLQPSVSIDMWMPFLILVAMALIFNRKK